MGRRRVPDIETSVRDMQWGWHLPCRCLNIRELQTFSVSSQPFDLDVVDGGQTRPNDNVSGCGKSTVFPFVAAFQPFPVLVTDTVLVVGS